MTKIKSRVEYYSITISIPKPFNQSAQFIKLCVTYTWFKSTMFFKTSPIFHHAHPIIIKVTFGFPEFLSYQKSVINNFWLSRILFLSHQVNFIRGHSKSTLIVLYDRSVKKNCQVFKQQVELFLISCLKVAKCFFVLSLVQHKKVFFY